jgi:hypothetical protein
MGVEPVVPIGERRGAVVAGALVCAVLLVVGYGSGVGVVPARPGDVVDGEPAPGEAGAEEGEPDGGPTAPGRETGSTSLVNSSSPSRSGKATTSPNVVQPARPVLSGTVPPSTTPPITPPGTTPPGTSPPPGPTPPPSDSPAECADLTGDLVQALTGYLAGPNPDAALVQRVSDVLGLGAMVPSDSLLGGVVTPVGGAVSTLGSTLDPNTDLTSALVPDAGLVPGLRALLGVTATGPVTVTAQQLTAQLDAVSGGC